MTSPISLASVLHLSPTTNRNDSRDFATLVTRADLAFTARNPALKRRDQWHERRQRKREHVGQGNTRNERLDASS